MMATKNKILPTKTFGEQVDEELDKRGSTRRWLMSQLKDLGFEMFLLFDSIAFQVIDYLRTKKISL